MEMFQHVEIDYMMDEKILKTIKDHQILFLITQNKIQLYLFHLQQVKHLQSNLIQIKQIFQVKTNHHYTFSNANHR